MRWRLINHIFVVLLVTLLLISPTKGYTHSGGVEVGDIVIARTILKLNDTRETIFRHTDYEIDTIDEEQMKELREAIIGMKIGNTK